MLLPPGVRLLWLAMMVSLVAPAAQGQGPPDQDYPRVSLEEIKQQSHEILSDPAFRPQKSFWQKIREKFRQWDGPDWKAPQSLSLLVKWIVVTWCVLALLAILGHIVWTLWLLARRRSGQAPRPLRDTTGPQRQWTWDDLSAEMEALAGQGHYRQALAFMMLALINRLDQFGLLRNHASKTNGDFVNEYPYEREERGLFRGFVNDYESVFYGGTSCDHARYDQMSQRFREICEYAQKQPQA